jgi:hypothetical protein
MSKCIVGYTGFVGSNLLQFYKFDYFYNSKNFKDIIDKTFDEIYFCGVPAVKWYANKNPDEDLLTINNIIDILKTIKVNKFYLISTIDVYEDVISEKDENYICNYKINHPYGKNRYIFEQFIISQFPNHHIIRLPALFGKGLKKNIIYDLLNNNGLENIPINSSFQWYDLNWLKQDIEVIIKNNIKICNFFTEPLNTINILNLFNYDINNFDNTKKMSYNLKTKYGNNFNSSIDGYIRDKKTVETSIKDFINFYKLDKQHLVVSNICVKDISQLQFACILKLYGITNVQIAPTTITSWDNLNNIDLSVFTNNNLKVYSFQSITFTLNELNIFNENNSKLLIHLKNVIDVASKNNIKILVFGCPRNRFILNSELDNNNTFVNFFKELGNYCYNKNVTICIEPNSKKYNCNYLNTISEVGNIVRNIDKDNIKMMVDLGNAIMENDDLNIINNFSDIIYNIDVAEENMKSFINPNNKNNEFRNILKNINYNKKINLEMLLNTNNELDNLITSLNNFINIYLQHYD